MYKELVICIIIVISIFMIDFTTQKYTKNRADEITSKMEDLKEILQKTVVNKEELFKKMDNAYESWLKFHDVAALYIEHTELEKVETNFVSCKSFMEEEFYDMAINELDKTTFGLKHISDKYAFSLINIF